MFGDIISLHISQIPADTPTPVWTFILLIHQISLLINMFCVLFSAQRVFESLNISVSVGAGEHALIIISETTSSHTVDEEFGEILCTSDLRFLPNSHPARPRQTELQQVISAGEGSIILRVIVQSQTLVVES